MRERMIIRSDPDRRFPSGLARRIPAPPLSTGRHWLKLVGALGISFATVLILSGCESVGPNEQRLVSKANMVFSDSAVFGYENKLLPQLEPGSAVSGGQASGCTSCR